MRSHRKLIYLALLAFLLTASWGLGSEAQAATADLFISEYIEGSSFNKAIEIYNGTGGAIDLAAGNYTLELYSNGATSPNGTLALTGTIADGDVYVLANSNANGAILAVADITNNRVINFNGDDAVVLRKNGAVVDAFGQIGVDPGSEWSGGGQNDTLQRLASVCAGDTNPDDPFSVGAAEWTVLGQDTFSGLGTHVADCGGGSGNGDTLLLTEIVVTPTDGEFVEIHNPTGATIDLSDVYLTDATFAGGSTYYYNLVTGTNAGGGGFTDFNARFPDSASIGAGEYQTVAMTGSDAFAAQYGFAPTYELFEDGAGADAVPDMREAVPGSINGQGGLTNGGEVVILYSWDGAADIVADLDYVVWGDKVEAVDKTGVATDGPDADSDVTAYLPDTAIAAQIPVATGAHAFGNSWQRDDLTEGNEIMAGGNGLTGHDETSEDLDVTWCEANPTPNAASICEPPIEPDPVVINEILADPASGAAGDANGDGVRNGSADEFVEIVNVSGAALDISNWTISDAVAVRHTFPVGTILPADCAIVVFGGDTPTGLFGGALVQTASNGFLGFNNGGDTITVANGGTTAASVSYGSEGGDNQSLTLEPDVTGTTYVKHSEAAASGGTLFSPGTQIDGGRFAGCQFTHLIHEVQGAGLASPLDGATVTVEGIVVGDFQENGMSDNGELDGFFLQEEDSDADGNPVTSEGIYIFDGSGAVDVMIGDRVRVTGRVDEFFGLTELTSVTEVAVLSHGQALPTAANVSLPVTSVEVLEQYEGMKVTFAQPLYISEFFNFDRFGEIVLTAERQFQPTAIYEPYSPDAVALADLNARSRITLDDGRTSQNPDPAIHPNGLEFDLTNTFRGGDIVQNVTGVLNYSFGLYRVQPTVGADYIPQNERTEAPDPVDGSMTVASFNVLNYFTTLDENGNLCGPPGFEQGCRGADNAEEFQRQRDKILAALAAMDADVVGLIEIQNDSGESVADLVAGLNDLVGAGTYSYIDTGYVGTDVIKVALIYKSALVTPVGGYAVLDSSVDARFDDNRNRPALAQSFVENATGGTFTVVVNHLKSKGSGCGVGDDDPVQGNCNLTRTLAAQAMADWLATDPTGINDPDILIIGDLNAYDKEDPINALLFGADDNAGTGDDYQDLLLAYQGENAYSYVFNGQLGYLDHALGNLAISPEVTGATAWHINSDEPDILDYDTSFKQPAQAALYEPNAYRSSDHDPVLIGLDLNGSPVCTAAQPSQASLWPPNHKMVDIDVVGVTDPEDDPFTINIDAIFQDEAVNGDDDGNTAPDGAGVGTATAAVRAERDGEGNGRVYTISFTAIDAFGNTCQGAVQVAVPLSRNSGAVDDGPLFDSTIDPNATSWLLNGIAMQQTAVLPTDEDWLA